MNDEFTDRLSDYIDDELDDRERAAVKAHLATCADCRGVLHDLQRVVATAQGLPPRPPATDLWPAVAESIPSHRTTRWWQPTSVRSIAFTLPQAVAATVLIALLSGGMVWWLRGRSGPSGTPASSSDLQVRPPETGADHPVRPGASASAQSDLDRGVITTPVGLADAQYDAAVADLQKALAAGRGRLDPATVAVIEQSLDAIDHAIAQARQALESDPANAYLSDHLVETRRRKLDLLRRAAALTMELN